ncbi:MAG TPA: class I SAM-dependent methyltransferase [Steroidobacteraceae bacterium]|jgi:SAM-dependent methyltransferase|nr:class I SAM-dependent methyltransferase [Steroidobacteraceae bacterium]
MPLSSSDRFLGRAEAYAKYRPGYPAAAIDLLEARCGLRPGAAAVDVGSGTGILSALLLQRGARVFGIEPNSEMRACAASMLGGQFSSGSGTAECTRMPDRFFDLMVCGQAFHWFDPGKTRVEALRILKPGAWAALLWNETPKDVVPFLDDYEALLRRYAPEYDAVAQLRAQEDGIRQFFGHVPELATFANEQLLDFAGLEGRVMSSSYAPLPDRPEHAPLLAGLREVFDRHQREGRIVFPYRTLVYFGQPDRPAQVLERR